MLVCESVEGSELTHDTFFVGVVGGSKRHEFREGLRKKHWGEL